jgi:NAD(P)-dependent dehydrogenase (short-subunit alcohol dehydrogenase family)
MTKNDVLVITGAGGIGQAIARRQGPGKHILLADISEENLDSAAHALEDLGHRVSTQRTDVSSRKSVHALANKAAELGNVAQVVHTAGVSPVQAPAATILAVDLLGTALVLEELGRVIASSPRWPATCSGPSTPSRSTRWPTRRPTTCSPCHS